MKKVEPFKVSAWIGWLALILIGVAVAAVLLYAYGINKHSKNLTFSYEPCGAQIDPYGYPYDGILSSTWEQDILVIEAFTKKPLCGGANAEGDYRVEGDNLTLLYSLTGQQTECNCTYKLEYRISGLKHQQYTVSIHDMDD